MSAWLVTPESLADAMGVAIDEATTILSRLPPEPEPGDAGLTEAWAEAEAAVPNRWGLALTSRDGMYDAYASNPVMSSVWEVAGTGPTPAAALTDLVAKLLRAAAPAEASDG